VLIDWSLEFDRWLDRLETEAKNGDQRSQLVYDLVSSELVRLQRLTDVPTAETETAMLKWVRQSRRYRVWRVSHPYREGIAVRLICWFPPSNDTAVIALFAGDKGRIGDVWYDSVGTRADAVIDQWLRETALAGSEESDDGK
jgi:hypothetical protein